MEIHRSAKQRESVALIIDRDFLAEALAFLVIVVAAGQPHVRDVEIVALEASESAIGGDRLDAERATVGPVDDAGQARALPVIDRFLIGIDVAKVRLLATRGIIVEDRLAAEQLVRKRRIRNHRRSEIVEGVIVVVLTNVIDDQRAGQRVSDLADKGTAQGVGIAIVDRRAGEQVHAIAVAPLVLSGDPRHQPVTDDTAADRALQDLAVVIAVGRAHVAAQLVRRTGRDHVDRARGRTTAVEDALRPAQHLNLLQVEEATELLRRTRQDRAILKERDRALTADVEVVEADTADEGAVHAELVADRHIGHHRLQVGDILDTAGCQLRRGDRADRRRRAAERRGLFRRGDDDVADAVTLCALRVCRRSRRRGRHVGARGTPRRSALCKRRSRRQHDPGQRKTQELHRLSAHRHPPITKLLFILPASILDMS